MYSFQKSLGIHQSWIFEEVDALIYDWATMRTEGMSRIPNTTDKLEEKRNAFEDEMVLANKETPRKWRYVATLNV